jgi:serine protease Do
MALVAGRVRRADLRLVFQCLTACVFLLAATGAAPAAEPTARSAPFRASAETTDPPQGIADLKALEDKVRATVAKVAASVVSVAGGSGVVINEEGYVLTVAHVGEHAGRNVMIVFANGRRARGVTLGNDEGVDAGMIKLTAPGPWPSVEMGTSKDLKPGQWCLTLGYPVNSERGKSPLVRIGRVLSNRKTEIITDCTIMGGDSGAPLFNLDGKLIGIGTKCTDPLTHNIHVPIDRYRDDWELLTKGQDFDSLTPAWVLLGFQIAEDAKELRIRTLAPRGAAETAGLAPGDVLLKFAGQELRRNKELTALIVRHKPGDKLEIEVRRGDETLKHQLTLGPYGTGQNP